MNLQFCVADATDIPVIFTQAKDLIDRYEDITTIDYDRVLAWVEKKIRSYISEYRCVLVAERKLLTTVFAKMGNWTMCMCLRNFKDRGLAPRS